METRRSILLKLIWREELLGADALSELPVIVWNSMKMPPFRRNQHGCTTTLCLGIAILGLRLPVAPTVVVVVALGCWLLSPVAGRLFHLVASSSFVGGGVPRAAQCAAASMSGRRPADVPLLQAAGRSPLEQRGCSQREYKIPIPTLYDPILSRREFHSAKGNDFRGAHEVFALRISSSRHLVRFAAQRHKIIRNLESFGSIDSNDPLITAAVPATSATRCTKSRQP